MDLIIQISAAVATAAFVILVVAAVVSLRRLNRTMESVESTLNEVRPRLEELANESERTLKEARSLIEDVNQKTRQTDAFFETIHNASEKIQEFSNHITHTASLQRERLGNLIAIVSSGMDLWKKWRSIRPTNKETVKKVK